MIDGKMVYTPDGEIALCGYPDGKPYDCCECPDIDDYPTPLCLEVTFSGVENFGEGTPPYDTCCYTDSYQGIKTFLKDYINGTHTLIQSSTNFCHYTAMYSFPEILQERYYFSTNCSGSYWDFSPNWMLITVAFCGHDDYSDGVFVSVKFGISGITVPNGLIGSLAFVAASHGSDGEDVDTTNCWTISLNNRVKLCGVSGYSLFRTGQPGGTVSIKPNNCGCPAWDSDTSYDIDACVSYAGGQYYSCSNGNQGNAPEIDATNVCETGFYWRLA